MKNGYFHGWSRESKNNKLPFVFTSGDQFCDFCPLGDHFTLKLSVSEKQIGYLSAKLVFLKGLLQVQIILRAVFSPFGNSVLTFKILYLKNSSTI